MAEAEAFRDFERKTFWSSTTWLNEEREYLLKGNENSYPSQPPRKCNKISSILPEEINIRLGCLRKNNIVGGNISNLCFCLNKKFLLWSEEITIIIIEEKAERMLEDFYVIFRLFWTSREDMKTLISLSMAPQTNLKCIENPRVNFVKSKSLAQLHKSWKLKLSLQF